MRGLVFLLLLCVSPLGTAHTVLILGDSISAAYGIDKSQGWVSLLEQRLQRKCPEVSVNNASVSGEITAGGLARLPTLLERHQPVIVVIELGGNDGLRGLPPKRMQQNLEQMIALSRASGAEPLLFGMKIPPNYGVAYNTLFEKAFIDVARQQEVPFIPFFLEGVADQSALMQDDGIHPGGKAQAQLLDNAWGLLDTVVAPYCPQ